MVKMIKTLILLLEMWFIIRLCLNRRYIFIMHGKRFEKILVYLI